MSLHQFPAILPNSTGNIYNMATRLMYPEAKWLLQSGFVIHPLMWAFFCLLFILKAQLDNRTVSCSNQHECFSSTVPVFFKGQF